MTRHRINFWVVETWTPDPPRVQSQISISPSQSLGDGGHGKWIEKVIEVREG
ncbi:hypothetical protein K443DRAFT_682445 [Laccaria amethystina LaAM-08-1]|uniref:Uncharacterized protein n=1 Tax=Laccaria amethystina LaAM-08-1 TaxID=1095629 RepID=A0A0C9X4I5_9AGAR|nr:hypothetical protein K443DRAFT_682445 [Laccaria amethystina LaAM-08-1]